MNKEEFKAKASQTIDEVYAKLDDLKAKKAHAKERINQSVEDSIEELEARKTELEEKYHDLKTASDEKWEDVKGAFSSAADSFKEGISKIASVF